MTELSDLLTQRDAHRAALKQADGRGPFATRDEKRARDLARQFLPAVEKSIARHPDYAQHQADQVAIRQARLTGKAVVEGLELERLRIENAGLAALAAPEPESEIARHLAMHPIKQPAQAGQITEAELRAKLGL